MNKLLSSINQLWSAINQSMNLYKLDESMARLHLKSPWSLPGGSPYTSPFKVMAKVKLDGH